MNSDEFINKNKNMLIQEMASTINMINLDINNIIEIPEESVKATEKIIHGLALNVGYLTAIFNQYYVLLTGKISEQKQIGFKSLEEDK
jgi:nanoRNase/pAp phosphatase (c-di-AMP/oligoRNAs hydrolase)